MKKKAKSRPRSKTKLGKPYAGKIQATLTFELPEAEEFLELTLQAWKWRQAVGDFMLFLMKWRDAARTEEERNTYRGVKTVLRDHLAESGLSLHTRERQEQLHQERLRMYSNHLDALIKKSKKLMKDEDEAIEQELGKSQAN